MKGSGIGGQAVMEGVMMKNGSKYAVAVRKPDGEIVVDTRTFKKTGEGIKLFDLPLFRGVIAFIDSLRLGVGTLMYSADVSTEEEEPEGKKKSPEAKKKEDSVVMALTVVIAVVLAIGIFMILPYYLSQLLKQVITSTVLLTLCEGLIRIGLFIGYVAAISCMKDIKRVFMYHGAEHKSINCVESGLELTVENIRKSSRRHKRCGTSFLLVVMLISVVLFMFIRVETAWLRILLRLLLIPVIAGISYEFIRLAGKSDSKLVNILSKPGLALQGLTTSEPDDSMIEVAIASVEAVFDWREFLEKFDEKPSKGKNKNGKHENRKDNKNDNKNNTNRKDNKAAAVKENTEDNREPDTNRETAKDPGVESNKNAANNNTGKNQNSNSGRKNGKHDKHHNVKDQANDNSRKDRDDTDDLKNFDMYLEKSVKQSADERSVSDDTAEKVKNIEKELKQDIEKASTTDAVKTEERPAKFAGAREVLPVDDDEDDEILKALDQYFTSHKKK